MVMVMVRVRFMVMVEVRVRVRLLPWITFGIREYFGIQVTTFRLP